jgi:ferulate-5-hydroxylase
VVKEILRLHPPVPLLLHETASDCVVGGYAVPVGSRVIVNAWAINRDGAAWGEDAGAFRPARFMPGEGEAAAVDFKGGNFEFIPFGSGRRACPAIVFGLYELELALARLVHAFEWALPGGMAPEDLDMEDVFGLTATRAVRLHAVPTLRLTCPL